MATLTLQPPAPFDFSKPVDWPKWIKRFEQYRVAPGLSKDSGARQVLLFGRRGRGCYKFH